MRPRGIVSVALAYPAAAAAGATIVAVEFAAVAMAATLSSGLEEMASGWWVLPVAWIYAFVVFLVGLLAVGTPVWLLMVGLKRSGRRAATIVGAVLAAIAGFLIFQLLSGTVWSWGPLVYAALLAIPGAVAGWVLHRVAYGRT